MDGLRCQHSSLILFPSSFLHSVCDYGSQYVFSHLLSVSPACCHSAIVFSIIPPSHPPFCLPLTVSLSLLFLAFNVLLLSFLVYLSSGLFSADWFGQAHENWVGMFNFVSVCVCGFVNTSVLAYVHV